MRRDRHSALMTIAEVVASRSTCNRLQVGAVIARDFRVISTGYNGAPASMKHCDHAGNMPCKRAVHAELNAILFAARHGVGVEGAELFTTHSPCLACAQAIINAGITRVFYDTEYRKDDGVTLLNQAGVRVSRVML